MLFEDICFTSNERHVTENSIEYLSHGEEVYYHVSKSNLNEEYISKIFYEIGIGFHETCVLTTLPKNLSIKDLQLTDSVLDELAQRTEGLVLEAFDQQGYILCKFD